MPIEPPRYVERPAVGNAALNALFAASWPAHSERDFERSLPHCLTYFCAYAAGLSAGGEQCLIGFVKLAWDGDSHAFLLDPTVLPEFRRRGIGGALVGCAVQAARARGLGYVHVDYEPNLEGFYRRCGFAPTHAGLLRLEV